LLVVLLAAGLASALQTFFLVFMGDTVEVGLLRAGPMDAHELIWEAIAAKLNADLTREKADRLLAQVREFRHQWEERFRQVNPDALQPGGATPPPQRWP
jgi:hypothetical protein